MVAPKMAVPLKLVVLLMLVICLRRAWYSVSMAVDWEELSPEFEASVARVTARLSSEVTWARAPSAVWSEPTALVAFSAD